MRSSSSRPATRYAPDVDPEHAYTALLELEARGLAVAAAARRLRGQVRRSWVAQEDTERELATLRA
ncbi:MAG: hypothetical protein RL139_666, partial [Gemmatimonadota bacterium]